jgi:hypothetical protein
LFKASPFTIYYSICRLNCNSPRLCLHPQNHQLNLVSARAVTVPPKRASPEEIPNLSKEELEKNDDLINNVYIEHPCVAQIEVLFDIQITLHHTDKESFNRSDKIPSATFVGVFEGWLYGSPSGSLQWKLGLTRSVRKGFVLKI